MAGHLGALHDPVGPRLADRESQHAVVRAPGAGHARVAGAQEHVGDLQGAVPQQLGLSQSAVLRRLAEPARPAADTVNGRKGSYHDVVNGELR